MKYVEIKNDENYAIDYTKIFYHYAVKIYDSLRTGYDKKELYLSTRKGLKVNGYDTKPYMDIPHGGSTSITP